MEIATGCSKKPNEQEAVLEACNQLVQALPSPSFVFMVATINYNNQVILNELNRILDAPKIMGGTSCIGLFTEKGGYCSERQVALGLLGFKDDNGCFGIAGLSLSDNPFNDGAEVISRALNDSGRPGEIPSIILMTSAPGHEEALIDGIMSVVGTDVPIFGGSSADNSISGKWQQFCGTQIFHNGITIAVIYSSKPIGYAFHNGYMPTEHNGIITKVEGRIVRTIDDKSAAEIYNQWSGGLITKSLGSDSNILAASTLNPLGRAVGTIGTIPYYNLSHPNQIFADGSMSFFTTFCENDSVVFMEGTVNSLKTRVKRVIHLAKENYSSHHLDKPKGALIIYCAGCFLALEDQIEDVVSMVYAELPSEPFLGMFTFGEQGCLFGGENRHGNLMISAIVFG